MRSEISRRESLALLLSAGGTVISGCGGGWLGSAQAQAVQPNLDAARIRAIVEAESGKAGTKAVQFGVWSGSVEILSFALGHSMTTVPATTNMHYRIGGISETFLSTLVMLLAEQGRIRLDDTIDRWYPNLVSANKVTIRMLLANTSGYFDYVLDEKWTADLLANPFRNFTPDELISYGVRDGKLNYEPGTSQRYSHTEYLILDQVVEKATGESMKSLFEKNIFAPIGLKDTQLPLNQEIQAPVLHAYSEDRGIYEDSTYWNPSWVGAYGGLTSTLHDLGKWGHVFGSGALLSTASYRELTGPHSVGIGRNRPDLYFAYGFIYASGWLVQNPNINGYSGGFAYNLASGVTVVVAATTGPKATIDPAAIHILHEVIKYVTPATPLNF